MSKKAVTAAIVPYADQTASGRTVSREHKDTARMTVTAQMRTENHTGEKISDPGVLCIELEVNTSGLVAVTAVNADAPRTKARPLFYGQIAIGPGDDSGTVVRRETESPTRPAGALNLSAAQVEQIRAALDLLDPYSMPGEDNATIANAARAALGMPAI